ncbi:class I SAM-dependent methyltransferase [Mycobacterium sp. EPa45]|uniref:class I SAM-dependent methyltransferase n=1 Tax=Mycobacterium sp. EPa45 TaxID=1545728 RepID=UPI0006423814|nr:class I SAM-dependent methyltransferase [Mycobacterium sp. EPa45]AKK26476.1 SAM-dependent methyltransferase [Mycobacterium sp. EPa45]
MSFEVPPEDYARFMGRYAEPLAPVFAAFAGISSGDKVLDVGCGTGALTAHLRSVGADVKAIDPSPPFVAAIAERLPDVDARLGIAEELPFATASFDACLAQLVVHFMTDPVAGLEEMARVTRPGGTVAACVWDGTSGALAPFWDAVHMIAPDAQDDAFRSGASAGHLTELFGEAGLTGVREGSLAVEVLHATFQEWWQPYTFGIGPAGEYVRRLDADAIARLEATARKRLGDGPFTVTATAWAARGVRI